MSTALFIAFGSCICSIAFMIPFFVIYFTQYKKELSYIQTQCTITEGTIKSETCTYQCNCMSNGNQIPTCQQCFYTCYQIILKVSYSVSNITLYSTIYGKNCDYIDECKKWISLHPANSYLDCYYDTSDPSNVISDYTKSDNKTTIIVLAIFMGIGLFFFICSCFILFVNKCNTYIAQSEINRITIHREEAIPNSREQTIHTNTPV